MHTNPLPDRKDPRESVFLNALVMASRAQGESRHRVRNLSRSGACVDMRDELALGDRLRIEIGAETLEATVAWVRQGQAGIRFDRDIDLVAARKRPPSTSAPAQGGWIGSMSSPYRR